MKKINTKDIVNALKVFEVSTPQKPGNWMGKVLTGYLNVGAAMATTKYIKNSVERVTDGSVGIRDMIILTALETLTYPLDVIELPYLKLRKGVKYIATKAESWINEDTDADESDEEIEAEEVTAEVVNE